MSLYARIVKRYGSFCLDTEFSVENEVLGLLGASGCGKSLTLKCIAGIETPDSGRITLNGRTLFDSEARIDLPPQQRRVGYLFQQYALFPNMTAEKNIAAGAHHLPKDARKKAVDDIMERMRIDDLRGRYPAQLSGGQQQRTALARILISEPEALLLDEPFSALDAHLRDKMEQEVMEVVSRFGGSTLLVSHNRDEIYRMSGRIAVYNNGRIDALDEKHALFRDPKTYTSALLTGCKNFSRVSNLRRENGRTLFTADDWGMEFSVPGSLEGSIVGFRRHYAALTDTPGENTFEVVAAGVVEDPFEYVLHIHRTGMPEKQLEWALPKDMYAQLPSGPFRLHFPESSLMLLQNN